MKTTRSLTLAMTMAMGMIAGLHASLTEHQPPAPLPEFKTPDQLAKWRSETTARSAATETAASGTRLSTPDSSTPFYTGKPYLAESGSYAFKYREYNPEMGRWTTVDPSGFPDGANNRVYGNSPVNGCDCTGMAWSDITFVIHYYFGGGTTVNLSDMGLLSAVKENACVPKVGGAARFGDQISKRANKFAVNANYNGTFSEEFINGYDFSNIVRAMGSGVLSGNYTGTLQTTIPQNDNLGTYSYFGLGEIKYSDRFTDPFDVLEFLHIKDPTVLQEYLANNPQQFTSLGLPIPTSTILPIGVPYNIVGNWNQLYSGAGSFE